MKIKKLTVRQIIIAIIVTLIVTLVVVNYSNDDNRVLNPIERFVTDSVLTIQKIIFFPIKYVENSYKEYKELMYLYDEYKLLKSEFDKFGLVMAQKIELEREVENLKSLLNLNETVMEYEFLNATVIVRDVDGWHNTLTIDKGSFHGVEKNMAVIVNEGLVGRIINSYEFNSEIKLLTSSDINNKVSAMIQSENGSIFGLVESYDFTTDTYQFVPVSTNEDKKIDISVGDKLVTSGYGGIFPRGIIIGEVYSVEADNFGLSKLVQVKPYVNFSEIRHVSIIKRKNVQE